MLKNSRERNIHVHSVASLQLNAVELVFGIVESVVIPLLVALIFLKQHKVKMLIKF